MKTKVLKYAQCFGFFFLQWIKKKNVESELFIGFGWCVFLRKRHSKIRYISRYQKKVYANFLFCVYFSISIKAIQISSNIVIAAPIRILLFFLFFNTHSCVCMLEHLTEVKIFSLFRATEPNIYMYMVCVFSNKVFKSNAWPYRPPMPDLSFLFLYKLI